MAIDLSDLATASSTANSLGNLVLVTPLTSVGITPQKAKELQGVKALLINKPDTFLFHYEGENTVSLESDITDHVVEDNSSIQDQISLKPEQITITGYIGELNDVPPFGLAQAKLAADSLALLSPFTPAVSISALNAYNAAAQAYSTAQTVKNSVQQSWNTFQGGPVKDPATGLILPRVQTEQQKAFVKFYGYWKARTLSVQTPWAIFDSMVIKTLRSTQDEDTRMISTFDITFKKMRFAKTFIKKSPTQAGRAKNMAGGVAENGPQNLTNNEPFTIKG